MNRLLDPFVRQIFVTKTSSVSAGVESDSGNAVVDGVIVTVGPVHLQRVPVGDARRVILARLLLPDPEGVLRIEVHDTVVLDVHAGHTIVGRGHEEAVVEPELERAGLEFTVPASAMMGVEKLPPPSVEYETS